MIVNVEISAINKRYCVCCVRYKLYTYTYFIIIIFIIYYYYYILYKLLHIYNLKLV